VACPASLCIKNVSALLGGQTIYYATPDRALIVFSLLLRFACQGVGGSGDPPLLAAGGQLHTPTHPPFFGLNPAKKRYWVFTFF